MKLEFQSIEKSFGEKRVLDGISFTASSGKAFGLLGRNGAGKTTAIRILMNVFSADSGKILTDGREIDYNNINFGYLPEERGLYPKKKIAEQLEYFAMLRGLSKKEARLSVRKWLERLGMSEYADKRLDTLSKGNQQKIQLITALSHNPDIIILDEPFSGLDPVNAMLLKDVVKEQIAENKIVLFSSHQMNYIEEFCDSIAILNQGRCVLTGELQSIKHSYPGNRLEIKSRDADKIISEYGGELLSAGNVIIKLPSENDKNSVMKNLTAEYDIDEISVVKPSLNDIFIEYTAKEDEVI